MKSQQQSNKSATPAPVPTPVKKPAPTNTNQGVQKQPQQQQQEAPFTTVVNHRNKTVTPPAQQQKPVNASSAPPSSSPSTTTTTTTTIATNTVSNTTVQQAAPVQVQHEQLSQRPPRQQEVPIQTNGLNNNAAAIKKPTVSTPMKIADIIKSKTFVIISHKIIIEFICVALPTSQTVVTELMLALDAASLSTDELDIIMHKIANKQAVIKKDWTKVCI